MMLKIPSMECKRLVFLKQLRESGAFDVILNTYSSFMQFIEFIT